MQTIKIRGIGTHLPGDPIDNQMIEQVFGIDSEWIDLFVGTQTRHFSLDLTTGAITHSLAESCLLAAEQAIADANIDKTQIDALVLATATPDHLMPNTVSLIMDRLGLNQKEIYQLQSGCSGALQALNLGCQLIRAGTKTTVLVMGGDVCNKFIDLEEDFSQLKPAELINYVLFGDGAGAVILSADNESGGMVIDTILHRCVGRDKPPGQLVHWRGKNRHTAVPMINEDYKAIEVAVPIHTQDLIDELISGMNCCKSAIDYLLPPQLSKNMTDAIVSRLNMPTASVINVVAETGNNGNALPFLQLEKLGCLMQASQKALLVAIESSKWIESGMALYA